MIEIAVVLQARLSSTRMPGKVLQNFANTQSILDMQLRSLRALELPLKLATTTNPNDDALAEFARNEDLPFYRGPEQDVLGRFIAASDAAYLIRICSDNPFLDIASITSFLEEIEEGVDYISYQSTEGTPAIRTHWGLFAEVVSRKALIQAHQSTENHLKGAFFREHVTNYIYGHQEQFNVTLLDAPEIIKDRNDLRFTIDTPEDFENMQKLYKIILRNGGDFSLENLVRTADEHEEIKAVMGEGIAKFSK